MRASFIFYAMGFLVELAGWHLLVSTDFRIAAGLFLVVSGLFLVLYSYEFQKQWREAVSRESLLDFLAQLKKEQGKEK